MKKGQENRGSIKKGEHRSLKTEFKKGERRGISTEFGNKPPWNKGLKGVQIPWNKGKKNIHSKETRERISKKLRKSTTPLKRLLRDHFKSTAWRISVFKRDNYTCQDCGRIGTILHAHHIKTFIRIIEENNITNLMEGLLCNELWDLDNGLTLCKDCHKLKHSLEGYRR